MRARGLRHWQFRPQDRDHGGPGRAGDSGGAPVHRHRAPSGHRSPPRPGLAGNGRAAGIGRFLVHARRGGRPASWPLRDGRTLLLPGRTPRGVRVRAVRQRPGSARTPHRGRHQPGARLRRGRRQTDLQRRHRLYPRWRPHRRAGLGPEELLAQRGSQLWGHRRRRRRLAIGRVDRRRRADHRHAGRRPAPVRRLRPPGLPAAQERGSLRQRLHHPFSGRGTARRPAPAHRALLSADEGPGRGVRPEIRLGAAQLVRAAGHPPGRPLVLPPLPLVRGGGRRMPQRGRERGSSRHDRLRQGPHRRPGGGGLPRPAGGQSASRQGGTGQPLPRPQRPGRCPFGIHNPARGRRQLLSGLRRRPAAPRTTTGSAATCPTTAACGWRT